MTPAGVDFSGEAGCEYATDLAANHNKNAQPNAMRRLNGSIPPFAKASTSARHQIVACFPKLSRARHISLGVGPFDLCSRSFESLICCTFSALRRTQRMDVHPPHGAIHGWRDFFVH